MVEKIIVNPDGVRGLGNIVSPTHSLEDYKVYMSTLVEGTEEIDGVQTVVYEMDPLLSDIKITLSLSQSVISIAGTATLTATVTEDDVPVSGVSVTFKQGDTVLGTSTTSSSGVATYTYTGADVGTYTLRATYSNVYSNAETLVVGKVNTTTTFTATPAMVTVGGDIVMTATVLDENSNPVNNEYVEFYVYYGGHSIALAPRKTNSSGVATYTWKTNRTGDMEAYAIFQNCPNYNSSESNHVPVSIDSHTYSLQFSESSYTATGGTCTVSVLLEKDSAPLANAEVTFSSDESSTVTATTGSDGVASATISFNDSTVLMASYNNITDTAEITVVPAYLFYDECTSADGLSQYGSSVYVKNSSSALTLSYDSGMNAYKVVGNTIDGYAKIPIPALDGKDGFYIEAEFFSTGNDTKQQSGICIYDTNSSAGNAIWARDIASINRCGWLKTANGADTSEAGNAQKSTLPVYNNWYKLRFEVNGTTCTAKWMKTDDTLIYSYSYTIPSYSSNSIGLQFLAWSYTYYLRNIKAEYL